MPKELARREFLGALAAFSLFPLEQEKPDLILHNGNIVTMNAREPRAQALAISRGRIAGVGSDADILNLAGRGSKKVDLGAKTVLPGFIDAHSHPALAGVMHLRMVDCDLRSISAIQAVLRDRAAKTRPGEWVLGFKYDDTKATIPDRGPWQRCAEAPASACRQSAGRRARPSRRAGRRTARRSRDISAKHSARRTTFTPNRTATQALAQPAYSARSLF